MNTFYEYMILANEFQMIKIERDRKEQNEPVEFV